MRIKHFLLSVSAVAALGANVAHANLITNGNFEQTTGSANKQLSNVAGTSGRTTLVGWTSGNASNGGGYNFVLDSSIATTSASALQLYGGNNGFTASKDGVNVFASDPAYYPATLSQTVSGLTIGTSYTLTFDYALGQQVNYTGANSDYWQVGFGNDTLNSSVLSIAQGGFSGWQTATMTFTATAASEALTFLAKTSSPGQPPFMLLDGVTLDATTVPEPSTLSLMLGGIGLAGMLAWRRRAKRG